MAQLLVDKETASSCDASDSVKMKKVILIEDQTILRDLICQLVEGYSGMEVIAQSGDGAEGYELCLKYNPDLVILDRNNFV